MSEERIDGGRIFAVLLLNIGISISQAIGGLLTGSLSLISDALHNSSDVLSIIVTYVANRLSIKPFSTKKTFGFRRAEILAAFFNSISLFSIAIFLAIRSIKTLYSPPQIDAVPIIVLALVSIVFNGLSVFILSKDSCSNLNTKSSITHLFSDMLTSIAVLFGGVMIYFWQIYWIDPILSFGISLYLIVTAWQIFHRTISIIMQFTPKNISIFDIESIVKRYPKINSIHHIHLWELTEKEIHLEAHIEFSEDILLSGVTSIITELKTEISNTLRIDHITLQPEINTNDSKNLIVDERIENHKNNRR